MIPLVDLAAQHREILTDVDAGFQQVMEQASFVGGPQVDAFEGAFADFAGRQACVGVANGTDALELALRALGVGPGHEVIVPATTFIATAEAPARLGARVVVVDVDPDTLLIDPQCVADSLTPHTRAVVPVHLYGRLAPMHQLAEVIDGRDIVMVEDAAQSQGARRQGQGIGSWSHAAATSFYPGKNLGAYGDAGAVVTDDQHLADRIRLLANHGSRVRYQHEVVGTNSRLDTLQAVVLLAKLRRLDDWNAARRRAADQYRELLGHHSRISLPPCADDDSHVWHLFTIRVPDRDRVLQHLHQSGIGAGIHYPVPLHRSTPFRSSAPRNCPVAETACDELLSLPLHPHLTSDDQFRVVEALIEALDDLPSGSGGRP